MSKKNEMLVMVACNDSDARDHAVGLISNTLSLARQEGIGPINKLTDVKVEHCAVKAGSMLAIMEEFRPGVSVRMAKVLHPDVVQREKVKDLVNNSIVAIGIENIAHLSHKAAVARHILNSERTDNIKVEELQHVLDPNITVTGKPADVQAVIEMALYGSMPEGTTNVTITYKNGKPCKTIGTF